jgi:signal transduction histidine kinase
MSALSIVREFSLTAKAAVPSDFRLAFTSTSGGETIRAYLIFGVLLTLLVGIAVQLAFREVGVGVLTHRLDLAQREAQEIAERVSQLGADTSGGVDFARVRSQEAAFRQFLNQRFAERFMLHHVEVRDRFGVRQLFVSRYQGPDRPRPIAPVGVDLSRDVILRAPVGVSDGQVLVGITPQPVIEEINNLRATLRTKVIVAAVLAVGVLIAGLFYVLHLLRKTRQLEHSRQSAARASYVGLLASGLAHEIRNPLNAMNMNLQMLEEELESAGAMPDQEYRELLDSTKSEIKRLDGLVNNFLAYARPGSPQFKSVDLNDVVKEILKFLENDFRQSQIRLESDLEPLLPKVDLDERQFKQALMNLLVNARQVLDAGGTVRVRTRAAGNGELVLVVEDDGPGIPEASRERIFEVFYSSRGGGTGLGLPIARQVVEKHGGTIELDSVVGEGARFTITLPRRHR